MFGTVSERDNVADEEGRHQEPDTTAAKHHTVAFDIDDVGDDDEDINDEDDVDDDEDSTPLPQKTTKQRSIRKSRRMRAVYSTKKEPSWMYELIMERPWCAPAFRKFPRTCAVFLGVIAPLFVLIFFSIAVGSGLADGKWM